MIVLFHKVRTVTAIDDYKLIVEFCEGVTKIYDVKPWFERQKVFLNLQNNNLFKKVRVDFGGLGICWNSEIDLECDELFYEGKTIKSKFDGLIALSDATILWGLNESTLRKAISYGKLKVGVDISKYGKQWVITMEAMVREYGEPKQ